MVNACKITQDEPSEIIEIGFTDLKEFILNPVFWNANKNKTFKSTPSMVKGSLLHELILGTFDPDKYFVAKPRERAPEDKIRLLEEEWLDAFKMKEEFFTQVGRYLDKIKFKTMEKEGRYRINLTDNIKLRSSPDGFSEENSIIFEYKTTKEIDLRNNVIYFKLLKKYSYDMQICYYQYILEKIFNKKLRVIYCIQSSVYPYLTRILEISQDLIDNQKPLLESSLELLKQNKLELPYIQGEKLELY